MLERPSRNANEAPMKFIVDSGSSDNCSSSDNDPSEIRMALERQIHLMLRDPAVPEDVKLLLLQHHNIAEAPATIDDSHSKIEV